MATSKDPTLQIRVEHPADVNDLQTFMAILDQLEVHPSNGVEIAFDGITVHAALDDLDPRED